ncbi:MAG: hypothetical protein WCE93_02250, partial [Nitrososphaeraceae archaeon]
SRKLIRFNVKNPENRKLESESINKWVYSRNIFKYSCEKCTLSFGTWKQLHQHKVESHSY